MIRVCDAIMGAGKSSAAITYMNEHPNEKFIYITPFLDEAARIKKSCPALHFVEPSNKMDEHKHSKVKHTASLIEQGRNIATTHQSFKRYTDEMLENIHTMGYTLLIDENMDTLEEYSVHPADVDMLIECGYLSVNGEACHTTDKRYTGIAFRELFDNLEARNLLVIKDDDDDDGKPKIKKIYCWALQPELLRAFKDVIIMTYLFEGQGLYQMLEMNHMEYEHIGVAVFGSGKNKQYRFDADSKYVPAYVKGIRNKIHILDNPKLNAIGAKKTALSMAWFGKGDSDVKQLKNNIYNCMNNIWRKCPSAEKLWGTYSDMEDKLKGEGYSKQFLTFNSRATNEYSNRTKLVYAVNLFSNVAKKKFFEKHGVKMDDDMYALSTMVQWIWRSAIRDGKEIEIYLPSRRMRELLINWMDKISKEAE